MPSRLVQLTAGTWYAGLTRPFLASRETVESMLRGALPPPAAAHVRQFHWHERAAEFPPIDPKQDPDYREDWTEWFDVEFTGEPTPVIVPEQLAWVLHRAPQQQPAPPVPPRAPPPPTPAPAPAPVPAPPQPVPERIDSTPTLKVAGAVVVLYLLWRWSRRGRR